MTPYNKPDYWSLKAQKEGYPARSVYKLKEIDKKFGLLRSGHTNFRVLDLGAAPGSWSLYALQRLKTQGFLLAADMSPLASQYGKEYFEGKNFLFTQGDITAEETMKFIASYSPFNLVISDAAPATTGNRSIDAFRSFDLAETALDYGKTVLVKGGNLVVKVFQGGGAPNLLKRIREDFFSAASFKPKACRQESFETYYIGLGKK